MTSAYTICDIIKETICRNKRKILFDQLKVHLNAIDEFIKNETLNAQRLQDLSTKFNIANE